MKILLFLMLAGCDSSPTMEKTFVGTWSFAEGTDNIVCPNGTTAEKLTGNLTIQQMSSQLLVLDEAGCNFTYSITGQDAKLGDDKECSFPVPQLGQGVTADVTYDAITLSLHDGMTISDVFSGKVVYRASTGNLNCAFSGSATLSKVK
jgi:hypothetical protein